MIATEKRLSTNEHELTLITSHRDINRIYEMDKKSFAGDIEQNQTVIWKKRDGN